MEGWRKFEHLVQRIHQLLDGTMYRVEHDVTITEPGGASHQVDVLLTPKASISGRVLVSCKSGSSPVGIEHVREWADIVQQTGAAAGIIVSPTGFTADAIQASRAPARRVSLWSPRPLALRDFQPDDGSRAGYIARVHVTGLLREPRPATDSFLLDVERVGPPGGQAVTYDFSAGSRNAWYLRDEQDNVVGNLWDEFVAAALRMEVSGVARVEAAEPRFLVLGGRRFRFRSLSMRIDVVEHRVEIDVDLLKGAFAYENVATGDMRMVPLPPEVLG